MNKPILILVLAFVLFLQTVSADIIYFSDNANNSVINLTIWGITGTPTEDISNMILTGTDSIHQNTFNTTTEFIPAWDGNTTLFNYTYDFRFSTDDTDMNFFKGLYNSLEDGNSGCIVCFGHLFVSTGAARLYTNGSFDSVSGIANNSYLRIQINFTNVTFWNSDDGISWTILGNRHFSTDNNLSTFTPRNVMGAGAKKMFLSELTLTNNSAIVAADTCSCPTLNTDWVVDMADVCEITLACNIGTGKLSFFNTGTFSCDAEINSTGSTNLTSGQTIFINNSCIWNLS